ncbi:MAG TPA: TonB-dependent receptor plug domain-containing protein [Bacteroidales bacterium]|nr:TonB-dependent receptor plug domain-containing protein [Bacteroidales bacterium]HRR48470.1 TonB-dependent receptor plug domain-containing protein [Bacteroidales bacterium]HRT32923.1 TonB-dependent receptor plug domain-containing protein [Bacteroidales bacterium]HRT83039.1 TonB-dependent receptor plug domain-containing protein [Bacteroidales bacterium]
MQKNKKLFKTIVIALFFICTVISNRVSAQVPVIDSLKRYKDTTRILPELIINNYKPTPFQPLVRIVSIINKNDIETSTVTNFPDFLRNFSGIDLRNRGSEGVQADLNILGGTFDQTMVLINGINFTDPQTGHYSLDIPISLSQIERIEVLQGPGAINIITNGNCDSNEVQARITGGSYGFINGTANIRFANGYLPGQTGGSYSQSDGYTENTDFVISNLFSNVTFCLGSGQSLMLMGGYQHKKYGANSFYSVSYPQQFEETRTFLSAIQHMFESKKWQIRSSIYQRRHYDRFELFRYEAEPWYSGHNYHQNDIYGLTAEAAHKWSPESTTIFGAGFRIEHIYSNVLGDSLKSGKEVPFEIDIQYSRSKQRNISTIYVKQTERLGKWLLTAGLTLDHSIGITHLCYGFSSSYSIAPHFEVNAWINNSFRNPTFTDLYYKSPTQTGNMNLRPEEMITGRTEFKYFTNNVLSSLSAFYRRGIRMIDWTRKSGSDQWQASNITNVNSIGLECSLRFSFDNNYLRSASFLYAWLDVSKKSSGLHSLYATDFLRHKAVFTVEHYLLKDLSASWILCYQKRAGTYLDKENAETPYKGFILTDLKLSWNIRKFIVSMTAANLFNKDYLYIGNLPQPGRWIKCGVEVRL